MDRFVSKKEFADVCQKTPAAITAATRPGKALSLALAGKKIDTHHVDAVTYMQKHGVDVGLPAQDEPATTASKKTKPSKQKGSYQEVDIKVDIDHNLAEYSKYLNMTLGDIIRKFGSMPKFKDHLNSFKVMSEIELRELQAEEKRGKFIRRDTVKTHIFGAMDTSNLRLLRDVPKTAAMKAASILKSGQEIGVVEEMLRDLIGKNLSVVRETAERVLRESE